MAATGCDKCLRYKDKVVTVTAGSKGIGEGCVRVFGMYITLCIAR